MSDSSIRLVRAISTEQLVGVLEAAEILHIRPSTVYAWVHQRRLPFRKHGRSLVFSRRELLEWSESRRVEVHSSPILGGFRDCDRKGAQSSFQNPRTRSLKSRRKAESG